MREFAFAFVAVMVAWPAVGQESTTSFIDAYCRKDQFKTLARLARTSVKELDRCHTQRLRGDVAPATDCNDLANAPSPKRITREQTKLTRRIVHSCEGGRRPAASEPIALGYDSCPAPCDAVPIDNTYSGQTSCLLCLADAESQALANGVLGLPTTPLEESAKRCQTTLARAVQGYFAKRMATQERCQKIKDRGKLASSTDCRSADIQGGQTRALAATLRRVRRCSDADLAALDSCAPTVAGVEGCLIAAANAASDTLFAAVYADIPAPVNTPTPTAAGSATPVPTATPTATSVPTATDTATASPSATATPVPTDTPTPVPTDTPTPVPTDTPTPLPTHTATPEPTSTATATATATVSGIVESRALPSGSVAYVTDMDNDGETDAVVVNGDTVSIHEWDGTAFVQRFSFGSGTRRGFAIGDLDGDSTPELVYLSNPLNSTVFVFEADGTGGYVQRHAENLVNPVGESENVGRGDTNGDGLKDILVAGRPELFRVVSTADNTYTELAHINAPSSGNASVIGGRDLDGDGLDEVGYIDVDINRTYLYEGTTLIRTVNPGRVLGLSDLDDDGLGELVVQNGTGWTIQESDGSGNTFTTVVSFTTTDSVAVVDVDGDGHDELWRRPAAAPNTFTLSQISGGSLVTVYDSGTTFTGSTDAVGIPRAFGSGLFSVVQGATLHIVSP